MKYLSIKATSRLQLIRWTKQKHIEAVREHALPSVNTSVNTSVSTHWTLYQSSSLVYGPGYLLLKSLFLICTAEFRLSLCSLNFVLQLKFDDKVAMPSHIMIKKVMKCTMCCSRIQKRELSDIKGAVWRIWGHLVVKLKTTINWIHLSSSSFRARSAALSTCRSLPRAQQFSSSCDSTAVKICWNVLFHISILSWTAGYLWCNLKLEIKLKLDPPAHPKVTGTQLISCFSVTLSGARKASRKRAFVLPSVHLHRRSWLAQTGPSRTGTGSSGCDWLPCRWWNESGEDSS